MKQTPQTKKSRRTKTMTEYMMKTDKNGKPRYYKSVDGKMKVISRAEYEENVKAEVEEVKSEAIVPAGFWNLDAAITELAERDRLNSVDMTPSKPEDIALSVVKCIVSGMDGRDDGKVKMQTVKHGSSSTTGTAWCVRWFSMMTTLSPLSSSWEPRLRAGRSRNSARSKT